MTKAGLKFVLYWLVTDEKETFDLKVNNQPVSTLRFLDSRFKLTDAKVQLFTASTEINSQQVTSHHEPFEYHPGIIVHKILEEAGEAPVTTIYFEQSSLETSVMNETLATFASLSIPENGLQELTLYEIRPTLEERISASVIGQLANCCKALRRLSICSMQVGLPKQV